MDSATHQARLPMSRMVKHMPVDSTKRERESKAVGNGKGKGKAGDYQKRAHQGEKTARETKKAKAVPNGAAGTRAAEVGAGAAEEGSEGGRSAARCQDCPFDNNLRPAKGPAGGKLTCQQCEEAAYASIRDDNLVMHDPSATRFPELLLRLGLTQNQREIVLERRAVRLRTFVCPYGDPDSLDNRFASSPCTTATRCSDCKDVRTVPGQLESWGKWRKVKNTQTEPKPDAGTATYWFHVDKKTVQWQHPSADVYFQRKQAARKADKKAREKQQQQQQVAAAKDQEDATAAFGGVNIFDALSASGDVSTLIAAAATAAINAARATAASAAVASAPPSLNNL